MLTAGGGIRTTDPLTKIEQHTNKKTTLLSSVSSGQKCPPGKGLESIAPLLQSVEETPDPIPTTIKGTVPTWINGSFLRNGPGKFEFGKDR